MAVKSFPSIENLSIQKLFFGYQNVAMDASYPMLETPKVTSRDLTFDSKVKLAFGGC